MTEPVDLHVRVKAAIEERLATARIATPGPWWSQATSLHMDGSGTHRIAPVAGGPQVFAAFMRNGADGEFVAANDPAAVIRMCQAALRVWARHAPDGYSQCPYCIDEREWPDGQVRPTPMPYPCPDFLDLADMFGVGVDGG